MTLWQYSLIYLILGIINVIFVIWHDPEIVYHREKIIIFSSFLFFPLFILFYFFTGVYAVLRFISPAIWWLLDKIADRGKKEDFGEDPYSENALEDEDNIGDDVHATEDDIVKCQTHCPCFRDRGL